MNGPQHSELCLAVRLPTRDGQAVVFTSTEGTEWEHTPGSISQTVRSETLWNQVDQDKPNRHGLLSKAGATLGKWLLNERAVSYLNEQIRKRSSGQPRLRIELRIPRRLAEYPWEIAACEGINHLAVHSALSVVRVNGSLGSQRPTTPTGQLLCQVVGVEHHSAGGWSPLQTAQEIEAVRQEIEYASTQGQFAVIVDQLGSWRELVTRYRERPGPPHIFHFAGHGLEQGLGLVFRGVNGEPEEVAAEKVAQLLASRVGNRHTHLVFLNACTSSAAGKGPFQPFGGVAELLVQQGIPLVVGLQTPVEDNEAIELARVFYAALSRWDAVDCALQEAREKLFFLGGSGVGWAFLTLTSAGQPGSLCQVVRQRSTEVPKNVWFRFGHREQRQRLEDFLSRKSPLVVIVHGEEGSGHRHVLERVQYDLEREGNKLWSPIVALQLSTTSNPQLFSSKLTGGIAHSLGLPTEGSLAELESRVAQKIADCCVDDQVLIIDLQEVLKFRDSTHAEAVLQLIQDVWVRLMEKVSAHRSRLPVFLLLSVAYPHPRHEKDPRAAKIRDVIALTEQTISRLQEKTRLKGNVRVEVLPKLQPFAQHYVAGFLEDVLELDPDFAESTAEHLVDMNDNETILERLQSFLLDRQGL